MVSKSIKKIWFIWLWLYCLILAGCFHIPDEDWLPSKNKPETTHKDDQVEQAINSFIEGIDVVSTQRDELNNNENNDNVENLNEIHIETEETFGNELAIENNTTADDENKDQNAEYDAIIEQ